MTVAILNARPRAASAGELARVRAAGSMPFTITDLSRRALAQLPAIVDHHAFVTSWRTRHAYQPFAVHGLSPEPLTCAVTAFRYCPVSHEVIHVIAIAYTPTQLHAVPLYSVDHHPLSIDLPVVCRTTVPPSIRVVPAAESLVATVADCQLPSGCYTTGFSRDVLVPATQESPTYFRRPGH